MIWDFINSLQCVLREEESDYQRILHDWKQRRNSVSFMPAVWWYGGTYNLFDQKAETDGTNMIWLIPAGQSNFALANDVREKLLEFYETDEINLSNHSFFPGIKAEAFEECILLHTDALQSDPAHTVLGANVVLVRLLLTSGRDTILFILFDHQDSCWKKIIEDYRISLNWFVDSGRGTENYYVRVNLYQLMKHTPYPEVLPALYFKGLHNKGEIPENFKFRYAMLSQPDKTGYDLWHSFSAVFDTGWNG